MLFFNYPMEAFESFKISNSIITNISFNVINTLTIIIIIYFPIYFEENIQNKYNKSIFNNFFDIIDNSLINLIDFINSEVLADIKREDLVYLRNHGILFTLILIFLNFEATLPFYSIVPAQLSITLSIALWFFIYINFYCILNNNINFLLLFLPANTPWYIAIFLIPIEFISYISRVISLTIRLFANILSSHLMMIIISMVCFNLTNLLNVPMIIIFIWLPCLCTFDLWVSFLQFFIFSKLSSIYIEDAFSIYGFYKKY